MLINYADVIMMTQPKFTSTILILQTLISVKKALHRRARRLLLHSLDDDTIHVIPGIWKHSSSVMGFFDISLLLKLDYCVCVYIYIYIYISLLLKLDYCVCVYIYIYIYISL